MYKKIGDVEQITIDEVSKQDLKLLSSIKHRVKQINGFGELSIKLTLKRSEVTNVKYTRIDENDNLG